jgi:MoaA/NifB/PqqE/SkfB family radical SAM enzyme
VQRKIRILAKKIGKNLMNNFCVLPFNSVSIPATGELRPCCSGGATSYHVKMDKISVDEIINHKGARALRSNFLKDKKDSICNRCWDIEAMGNRSFRHVSNDDKNYGVNSVIPIKMDTTVEFEDIQYLDITLGNKCNLACRMCNATSSSLLAKQFKEFKMYKGNEFIDFSRSTKDKILELINKSTNLNTIYMLGGEPLINDFHDEIVDLLLKTNRAKDIILHYSTNLQIDVEKYLNLWSKFKLIDLNISIDGTHETYEYIRWPGKWEKLYSNLMRACEYSKEANFRPVIATTVQNLNAHNIYNLLNECRDTNALFYFIPVTGSNYLELTPKHILQSEIPKLQTIEDPHGTYKELIQQYETAIVKHDIISKSQVKEFFEMQERFDKYRKQNLFATHPHFVELAEKFKIATW